MFRGAIINEFDTSVPFDVFEVLVTHVCEVLVVDPTHEYVICEIDHVISLEHFIFLVQVHSSKLIRQVVIVINLCHESQT